MRVLSFRELKFQKGIPYSRQHVGRLERARKFPRRIRLSPNSVAWIEEEIDAWLEDRAAERDSESAKDTGANGYRDAKLAKERTAKRAAARDAPAKALPMEEVSPPSRRRRA